MPVNMVAEVAGIVIVQHVHPNNTGNGEPHWLVGCAWVTFIDVVSDILEGKGRAGITTVCQN